MANVFDTASTNPSTAANQAVSGVVSNLARGTAPDNNTGVIQQTERLFTARARYGKEALNFNPDGSSKGGARGEWAYLKLLTSQDQLTQYLKKSGSRKFTYPELVSGMAEAKPSSKIGYDRFLLTGVSTAFQEKVQISEVFGDSEVVYYFGRQPVMMNFSGILIDSPDNNWFEQWIRMYDEVFRGSKLAQNYELIRIVLPNMVVTGSITGFSYSQSSDRDIDIPFQFQMAVKVIEPRPALNTGMMASNHLATIDWSKVNKFTGQAGINSLKAQTDSLGAVLKNPASSLKQKAAALGGLGRGAGGESGSWLESFAAGAKGFDKTVQGWDKAVGNWGTEVKTSGLFYTITSALQGVRTNLFSPIYGVMSSLTKLISNATNTVNSLFNALINPVRGILRDITAISKQAIAMVNLVQSSIKGIGRNIRSQLKGLTSDYKTAIKTLGKAAGTIMTAPATTAQTLAGMFSSGTMTSGAAFLQASSKLGFGKSIQRPGASLKSTKIDLVKGVPPYLPKTANTP